MSKFYGTVVGNRSEATRCGTASSGMRASAQSWNGSLISTVFENSDGDTVFSIEMQSGSGCFGREMLRGSYEDMIKLLNYANSHRDEILGK